MLNRFWNKVYKTDSCWLWIGSRLPTGYGTFRVGKKVKRAHRVSWELHNGPIIDGSLLVCHTCDNPMCVNPDHLFLGTNLDNMRDRNAKGRNPQVNKTHCPHGHEYTPYNTRIYNKKRVCRACQKITNALRYK